MNHVLPGSEHHIELTETYAAHNYHPLPVVLATPRSTSGTATRAWSRSPASSSVG